MAVRLRTGNDLGRLRSSARIVGEVLTLLRARVAPGVSTGALDALAERELRARGATPSFKGYGGPPPFPGSICVAINDQVVHGIPSPRQLLREGDIVGIDVGALCAGFHGDACLTVPVGRITPEAERLLRVTRECLALGIAQARPGQRIGDIGHAIETHARAHGYGVVEALCGHGVGRHLHEDPDIPHTGAPGTGAVLQPGMVFTIEPMLTTGSPEVRLLGDGWTLVTVDGGLSAQFEHTVAIRDGDAEVLTANRPDH